jgi:hypothetical protein
MTRTLGINWSPRNGVPSTLLTPGASAHTKKSLVHHNSSDFPLNNDKVVEYFPLTFYLTLMDCRPRRNINAMSLYLRNPTAVRRDAVIYTSLWKYNTYVQETLCCTELLVITSHQPDPHVY